MIRPDQIPDAVVEAAVTAFDASEEDAYVSHTHDIRVAIAAALNAWPMAHIHEWQRPWMGGMSGTDLTLPLPTSPEGRGDSTEADNEK